MATSAIARKINQARVLSCLFERRAVSRAELARDLGLTKSTLTNVVSDLLAEDLIGEFESESGPARVGRPGISIGLNPKGAYFLGAEIGVGQVRVVALDLTAKLVGFSVADAPKLEDPWSTLNLLGEMIRESLGRDLPANARIKGLCVGVAGFVSLDGVLLRAPHLGWAGVRVAAELRSLFRGPIVIDNNANLAAFGEWYLEQSLRSREIAVISLSGGVGCGMVSGGRIIRGAHGLSGELGHIVLDQQLHGGFNTVPMTWEQAVDKAALLDGYRHRTGREASLGELLEAHRAGAEAAIDVCSTWAKWMAYGLLSVIYAYDPNDIVVAGDMAPLFELTRPAIEAMLSRILIEGYQMPQLKISAFGTEACAAGAAAFLHHAMFDAWAIDGIDGANGRH